ncbi:MAG TPA: hypothetical protein VKT49_16815 [Bryobacteraceae bacterium]|nr:hypothetical protein [Bryobacteraceae bacterium]
MRFRTITLALVLACGLTATIEARTKKAKTPKRTYKAQKYKPPKFKPGKSPKVKHHA